MKNIVVGANMDYMTLKDESEKWGVLSHRINYYCVKDRIPGAVKMTSVWLLPQKADKRRKKNKVGEKL